MAAASGSASICASTGASPTGTSTAVGTGHSAPTPLPPPLNAGALTITATGGKGNVVVDVDEATCTGEIEPAEKKQKKCTSKVWDHYVKYTVTVDTKKIVGRRNNFGHDAINVLTKLDVRPQGARRRCGIIC